MWWKFKWKIWKIFNLMYSCCICALFLRLIQLYCFICVGLCVRSLGPCERTQGRPTRCSKARNWARITVCIHWEIRCKELPVSMGASSVKKPDWCETSAFALMVIPFSRLTPGFGAHMLLLPASASDWNSAPINGICLPSYCCEFTNNHRNHRFPCSGL